MNEPFVASVKMITGEEVLCEVMLTEENGEELFLVSNPIVFDESSQIDAARGVVLSGLIPKKWMMFADDGMTVVNKQHVVSMSELDKFGIEFYNRALIAARASTPIKRKIESEDNSGYIGTIDKIRERLNKAFNESPDLPEGSL
jgi:hypothetical protein